MKSSEDRNQRILQTLEAKIAMEKFEQENLLENRRKANLKSYIALKIGSIVALLGLVAGNVYSFATYKKDMFTVILEKMGVFSEYQNTSKEINITSDNNGFKLVLTDYGIDEDTLIVGYDLELPRKIENKMHFIDNSKLKDEEKTWEIDTNSSIESFTKISDTEYRIYKFYKIDASKLGENIEFDTDIALYEKLDELHSNNLAVWSFNTNLENDKMNLESEKYIVKNKGAEEDTSILEVSKSSLSTKITILKKLYSTEPGTKYYVEILDDAGNIILENNLEAVIGGVPTDVIFQKIDFNKKIVVNIYRTYYGEVEDKETITLDLENDLVKKSEVKDVEKESQNFRDIEFEYQKGSKIDQATYNEGMGDEEVYYLSIMLNNNVGNNQIEYDSISINCYKNLYNENLVTAVENINKLEYLGRRFEKEYTLFATEETTLKEDLTLSYEQMIDLADGKNVDVDGTKINAQMLGESLHNIKVEDKKQIKIDSEDAITWLESYGEETRRKYVFIVDEYIYEISCPIDFISQNTVEEFIDSISIH